MLDLCYDAVMEREALLPMAFGEYVRRRREQLGMTQGDLARAMETHQSTVARWEARSFPPKDRAVLDALAGILHTSVEALVGGAEQAKDLDAPPLRPNRRGGAESVEELAERLAPLFPDFTDEQRIELVRDIKSLSRRDREVVLRMVAAMRESARNREED